MKQQSAAQLGVIKPIALVIVLVAVVSCRDTTEGIRTQFVGSYAFSATERRVIARIAGDAAREARTHLPALAPQITLRVDSGKDVIPELGAGGGASAPDYITWTVDAGRPEGVVKIAEAHLRATLLHEFMHLVRYAAIGDYSVMGRAVGEGLATAFERDVAGASYPWGQYPANVTEWVEELLALPADGTPPEEPRWMSYRAGTYIVDRAMKKLNLTAAQLATMPTADIMSAAGFPRR